MPTNCGLTTSSRPSEFSLTSWRHLRRPYNLTCCSLYGQCGGSGPCEALANVYYEAVRAFGREAPEAFDTDEVDTSAYDEAVKVYEAEVEKAQAKGELPKL